MLIWLFGSVLLATPSTPLNLCLSYATSFMDTLPYHCRSFVVIAPSVDSPAEDDDAMMKKGVSPVRASNTPQGP